MNKQLLHDYKKWLLYSFDNQGFDNYYNLFKALETTNSFGTVTILKAINDEQLYYRISVNSIGEELEVTEKQRVDFLRYLTDNYFKTTDIDEIMAERIRQSDVDKNHKFIEPKNQVFSDEESQFKVKPHPKETRYFNIRLVISLIFYLIIAGVIAYGIIIDLSMLFGVLFLVPVVLLLALTFKIIMGIFVGEIRGNSIRVTKEQFPDIYEIIEEQARKIDVAVPEIYIMSGAFNAFVTKLSRSHILMLYSEVVETALRGNYDVLKYVTAHELCHIKQKHLTKKKYLFPSRIIPFLSLAHSRGCEYTCDRVGYHFSPKGSIEGVLIMTTGKEIYSKFNVELHIKNAVENEGFWTWFSEKFLTHPHLYKRLVEIKAYSKYN
jgi:Zn-dependent protease with chaperone function